MDYLKRLLENNNTSDIAVIERPPEVGNVETPEDVVAEPPMYAAMLHNDDSTAFNSVVDCLKEVFGIEPTRAQQLMLTAHNEGRAAVLLATKEVVETKVAQAQAWVTANGINGRMPNGACALTFTSEVA